MLEDSLSKVDHPKEIIAPGRLEVIDLTEDNGYDLLYHKGVCVSIVCDQCAEKEEIDSRCIALLLIPGYYDQNYGFICKRCSSSGSFQLTHEVKTREGFASTIICTLQLRTNKKFIPIDLILELMQQNYKLVRQPKGNWRKIMMEILTRKHLDNIEYFVQSKDNCWGFPDVVPSLPVTKGRKRKFNGNQTKPVQNKTPKKEDITVENVANPSDKPEIFFKWSDESDFLGCLPTSLDLNLDLTKIREELEENHIAYGKTFLFTYKKAPLTQVQEAQFTIKQCLSEIYDPMIMVLKKNNSK